MNSRFARCAALLACAAFGPACAKKQDAPVVPPAPAPSALAADRLLPGELAEGRERAMGLAVPREMRITRSFAGTVFVAGRVNSDALTIYVSQRIDSARGEIAPGRTVFPRAHVKGEPPDRQAFEPVGRSDRGGAFEDMGARFRAASSSDCWAHRAFRSMPGTST